MPYDYQKERPYVFTENGQIMFLAIRDAVRELVEKAGVCTISKAISGQSGDTWQMLACIDRMVEIGEIAIVKNPYGMSQYNIILRTT